MLIKGFKIELNCKIRVKGRFRINLLNVYCKSIIRNVFAQIRILKVFQKKLAKRSVTLK